ncbi:hypothetical protein M514_26037 [Trichuris suis]|uniref:Uncharacterized protein n=1 Tax=Trichuris suis TaxID=68888 RepID=A0A085MX45_9BILA|nr:hypothetical protein M514_26037 [Trichuris suis]
MKTPPRVYLCLMYKRKQKMSRKIDIFSNWKLFCFKNDHGEGDERSRAYFLSSVAIKQASFSQLHRVGKNYGTIEPADVTELNLAVVAQNVSCSRFGTAFQFAKTRRDLINRTEYLRHVGGVNGSRGVQVQFIFQYIILLRRHGLNKMSNRLHYAFKVFANLGEATIQRISVALLVTQFNYHFCFKNMPCQSGKDEVIRIRRLQQVFYSLKKLHCDQFALQLLSFFRQLACFETSIRLVDLIGGLFHRLHQLVNRRTQVNNVAGEQNKMGIILKWTV